MLIFCGVHGRVPVVPSAGAFIEILSLRIQEMEIRNYFQNFCDKYLRLSYGGFVAPEAIKVTA